MMSLMKIPMCLWNERRGRVRHISPLPAYYDSSVDTVDTLTVADVGLPKRSPPRIKRKAPSPARAKKRAKMSSGGVHKRVRWTQEEVDNLIEGVQEYGKGSWAEILAAFEFNDCRTSVNLKDKWRNLEKASRV